MQYFLATLAILLLNACASTVTSITKDQNKELKENTGYLLLGIQTNLDLKSIRINGPQNIELSSSDIKEGSNYFLIDLSAGQYTLDQLKLSRYWRRELTDEENWHFNVIPGKISYVGHLEVNTWGYWYPITKVELVNRSSESLEFLEDNFSNILRERPIVYGGSGKDDFFDFIESQYKEQK